VLYSVVVVVAVLVVGEEDHQMRQLFDGEQ